MHVILAVLSLACVAVYLLFFSPDSQIFGKVVSHIKTTEPLVALTFDDGPNEPYTSQLLDILAFYHVRATFFLVGKNIVRHPDAVRRIHAEGHEIGNHSYSHSFFKFFSEPFFADEIRRTQNIIARIVGVSPHLYRSPWLFRHPWLLQTVNVNGLTTVGGHFGSYLEMFQPKPERIAMAALRNVRAGNILIFHDGYNAKTAYRGSTIAAIALLIPELISRGYRPVTVSELLHLRT